jgi:magnesium-transporting ATPase (P-type)
MAHVIEVSFLLYFIQYFIYSNFVPISLLMTFEMIKFIQATFIEWDADLINPNNGISATV